MPKALGSRLRGNDVKTPAELHAAALCGTMLAMKQQQQATGREELVHNDGQSRYELRIDGQVAAMAQYARDGNSVRFTHTEVNQAYEGQGLGSRLAAFALDDVKSRGMKAQPQCQFIAAYIARNEKEYGSLVAR